jgi:hypothetical protein
VENSVGKLAANTAPNVSMGKRAWRWPFGLQRMGLSNSAFLVVEEVEANRRKSI